MTILLVFLIFMNAGCVMYILRLQHEKGGVCTPLLKKTDKSPANKVAEELINSLTNDSDEWTFTKYDAVNKSRDFEVWKSSGAGNIKLNDMDIFTPNQKTEILNAINDCLCNKILDSGDKKALEELAKYNKELLEG